MSFNFKKVYNVLMLKSNKQVYKKNRLFYSYDQYEFFIDTLKKQKNDLIIELYFNNLKFALLFEFDNRYFICSKDLEKEKAKEIFNKFMEKVNNEK